MTGSQEIGKDPEENSQEDEEMSSYNKTPWCGADQPKSQRNRNLTWKATPCSLWTKPCRICGEV